MPPVKVFLSYAHEDREQVRKLYRDLAAAGFAPWLDDEDILPGQEWENEIMQAMKDSDFVILCLSKTSVSKQGYIQTEMTHALSLLSQYPQDTVYLIPARLDDCPMPKSLQRKQSADLFTPNGLGKVIKALQFEVNRRQGKPTKKKPAQSKFNDIGFSVDAATTKSVNRLQFASDQLQPYLQSMRDSQGWLSDVISQQAPKDWVGSVSAGEYAQRLEYCQRIVDLALNVLHANSPVVNFLAHSHSNVGIGPGNIEEVRKHFNALAPGLPALIARANELDSALQAATWLPGDIRGPALVATDQIRTTAAEVKEKIPTLGAI